jgi:hypothetical protein
MLIETYAILVETDDEDTTNIYIKQDEDMIILHPIQVDLLIDMLLKAKKDLSK